MNLSKLKQAIIDIPKISEKDAECIFQQPVPIRMRFND